MLWGVGGPGVALRLPRAIVIAPLQGAGEIVEWVLVDAGLRPGLFTCRTYGALFGRAARAI